MSITVLSLHPIALLRKSRVSEIKNFLRVYVRDTPACLYEDLSPLSGQDQVQGRHPVLDPGRGRLLEALPMALEPVPKLLRPATFLARQAPLGRLAGRAEYHRDCLAFAFTMFVRISPMD